MLPLTVMMYVLTYGHALVKTLPLYQLMDGRIDDGDKRKDGWVEDERKE